MTKPDGFLPDVLRRLLDEVAAGERRADALVTDLDDEAVNWTPASGSVWSIAQCLNHLTVTNEFYMRGLLDRARAAGPREGAPFRGLRPTLIGRWFVASLEPPVRLKVRAPRPVRPATLFRRDELVPAFRASHDAYRALVEAAATMDVNRVIVPNPFQPSIRMRLSTVLLVIPAHDRRHLWQAENVLRARG